MPGPATTKNSLPFSRTQPSGTTLPPKTPLDHVCRTQSSAGVSQTSEIWGNSRCTAFPGPVKIQSLPMVSEQVRHLCLQPPALSHMFAGPCHHPRLHLHTHSHNPPSCRSLVKLAGVPADWTPQGGIHPGTSGLAT